VMYRIIIIYVYDIQLKVTKSNVLSVDLVTFACLFKQIKQGETHLPFRLASNQK
jgi:hypothetical protein